MQKLYTAYGKSIYLASLLAFAPGILWGTNGVYDIGWGTKAKAMGGVGVAYAQDSFSALANPANLADLSNRFDVGGGYLYHTQEVEIKNVPDSLIGIGVRPAKYPINGTTNLFYGSAGCTKVIDEEFTAALVVTPLSGGTNRVQKPRPPILPTEGVPFFTGEHERVFYVGVTPTLSYAPCFCPNHSFGVGIEFTGATVNFNNFTNLGQGVFGFLTVQNTSEHPNHITDKGWDYAWGVAARMGWLWHFRPDLTFGLSYKTKTFMSRFKKYEGLMTPQGRSGLPEVLAAGLTWKVTPQATLAFDFSRIFNSYIPSLSNDPPTFGVNVTPVGFEPFLTNPHGSNGGAAFNWKSQNVYKLGGSYDFGCFALMAGYNYTTMPVPKVGTFASTFVPAVIQHHLTFGGTWKASSCTEFSFCYVHGFKNTRKGFLAPPIQPPEIEELFHLAQVKTPLTAETDQFEIQFSCFF